MTASQNQIIESLQKYLTRIAHNLCHTHAYCENQDPDELLAVMNMAIIEQAERDPTFLNQTPGYISRRAAWAARDFCKREAYGEGVQPKLLDRADDGNRPFSEQFAAPQLDHDLAMTIQNALAELGERTLQIARMMMAGWKRQDIAAELGISSPSLQPEINRIKVALEPVYAEVGR